MANSDDMLRQAIDRSDNVKDRYATNYEDVKEAYREKYGERQWKAEYVKGLGLRSENVRLAKQDKQYQAALRSIQLYESGKNKSSFYANSAYAQVAARREHIVTGKELKGSSITLDIKAKQGDIRGGVRTTQDRYIRISISGSKAQQFVLNPNWETVWDTYGLDYDFAEEGDYSLDVYAVSA